MDAPKPFGLALSPEGQRARHHQQRRVRFSVTLIRNLASPTPSAKRVDLNATFMGVVFSPTARASTRRAARTATSGSATRRRGTIIGSVNLNGPAHPLDRPLHVGEHAGPPLQGRLPRQHGAHPATAATSTSSTRAASRSTSSTPRRSPPASTPRAASCGAGQLRRRGGRGPDRAAIRSASRSRRRRPHAVRHQRRRVPVHAPPAGQPDRRLATSTTRSAIPAPATRTRPGHAKTHPHQARSTRAICRLRTPARPRRHPLRLRPGRRHAIHDARPRQPQRARVLVGVRARRQHAGRRPTCARSSKTGPRVGERRRTASRPTAAATRTRSSSARTRSTSRTATTTASRVLDPRHATRSASRIALSPAARVTTGPLKGVQPVALALSPDEQLPLRRRGRAQRGGVVRLQRRRAAT